MAVDPYTNPPDPALVCPRCRGPVMRVRRNPFDRLLSLFAPRWRYRCRALACGWEGTIRRKR